MPAAARIGITKIELARFEKALGRLVQKHGRNVVLVVKKVAFDLVSDIMRATPVDTGRARAAWSVWLDSVGGAPTIGGDGSGVAAGRSEGSFKAKLPGSISSALRRSGTDVVFVQVTNNVKYILPLEFGWSKRQAPQGMVRVTVRRYARHLTRELKRAG